MKQNYQFELAIQRLAKIMISELFPSLPTTFTFKVGAIVECRCFKPPSKEKYPVIGLPVPANITLIDVTAYLAHHIGHYYAEFLGINFQALMNMLGIKVKGHTTAIKKMSILHEWVTFLPAYLKADLMALIHP